MNIEKHLVVEYHMVEGVKAGASVRVNKTTLIAPLPNRRKEKAGYYSTFGHIKR